MPEPKDLAELISLLAPGLIILGIRQWFVAAPLGKLEDRILSYAIVSTLYFAIASPAIAVLCDFFHTSAGFRVAWQNVFFPLVVGGAYGISTYYEVPSYLWSRLGIQPVHSAPTAWDYAFKRLPNSKYVKVTLTDGTKVYGLYAAGSFASSAAQERDLLISKVYNCVDGNWAVASPAHSILLCGRDIRAVEFF